MSLPPLPRLDAIIFDFDGVLLESEYAGNLQLAECLTALGHPISTEEAIDRFMGLSGRDFLDAIERWLGRPLPDDFHALRRAEDLRAMAEGIEAVAGAKQFVERLPPSLPRAVASSSTVEWIETHLAHVGLRHHFGEMIFSGLEHVERGKPAPDLYWHAAARLGVAIERALVIEDSPVGAKGALASGAQVVALCAGRHCRPGHEERLREVGVERIARSFDEIAGWLGWNGRAGP